MATAGRLNTPKRQRYASAIIALGLALGPTGVEAALVRPADVQEINGKITGLLRRERSEPGRRVVAQIACSELLVDAVRKATAAGDEFLVGGWGPRTSRVSNICRDIEAPSWLVPLNLSRLRDNFLVALMLEAHSVPELLDQAGVKNLEAFDRLMPYVHEAVAARARPDAPPMAVTE
jgi:hypothetical protein